MHTRSCHERRANTRYAGEEWAEDVDMIDADVHRMEDDRCVPDENSYPNVVPPVVTPGGHVDKRRRTVRSKKTHPRVADLAPLAPAAPAAPARRACTADQSGEYLDVGDRTTSCHFCDAPLWELEERDAHDEVWVWSEDDRKFDVQRRKVKCGGKLCCHKGKSVRELAHLFKRPAPDALQKLFDDRESKEGKLFHQNTRGLNIMFQMASSTISTSEHDKRYPHSVMVCEGNIYHLINPIETNQGSEHKFVQVYTIDGQENELATKIRNLQEHGQTTQKRRIDDERLLEEIARTIQQVLHEENDHVKDVLTMHETLKGPELEGRDVVKYVFEQKVEFLEEDPSTGQRDRNVYNKPRTTSEVMKVVDDRAPPEQQLVLMARNRGSPGVGQPIFWDSGVYLPLHFPLLYPYGGVAWSKQMHERDKITARDYAVLLMHKRPAGTKIHFNGPDAGRLFQELILDMEYIMTRERLTACLNTQRRRRAEAGTVDQAVAAGVTTGADVGVPCGFLPASVSDDAYFHERCWDTFAISGHREYGPPNLFVTMTCNPEWREIRNALGGCDVMDRPDVVVRVFNMKVQALIARIRAGKHETHWRGKAWGKRSPVFGQPTKAYAYRIEFQKRGLPHAHFLIWLQDPSDQQTG